MPKISSQYFYRLANYRTLIDWRLKPNIDKH
jgi:hypothetical protein